jgi:hypothetical protein
MLDRLIFISEILLVITIVAGIVRFKRLPLMARLILALLICAAATETIGELRDYVSISPEKVMNVYIGLEGIASIAGAFLLARSRFTRMAIIGGIVLLLGVSIYQYGFVDYKGLNVAIFLTHCVVLVAMYVLILGEAFLASDTQPMPTGILLLCVGVLVYCSLSPLAFPTVRYFYYDGKFKLASQVYCINTVSCILRYGLTLAGFLMLPRVVPRHLAPAT